MVTLFGSRLFFVSFLIVTKTLLTSYLVGSGPSQWGHPFRVEFAVWAYALDWNEVLFLNHIMRSFGMRSPFGSSVLLGTRSITNEGFIW